MSDMPGSDKITFHIAFDKQKYKGMYTQTTIRVPYFVERGGLVSSSHSIRAIFIRKARLLQRKHSIFK